MELIINEYQYIQDIIKSRKKPEHMSIRSLIRYLIRYYFSGYENKTCKEFQRFILNELKLFNFSIIEYQEYQYANYVLNMCRKYKKGDLDIKLRDFDTVDITKAEIKKIRQCDDEKEQKVLFTIYTLAKISVNPSGWVNYSIQEIFKRANVTLKAIERYQLIHKLYKNGFIELNRLITKHGYKVDLKPKSHTEITVKDFNHIGNTFLGKYKEGWMMCECCGKMVKKKSNRQKYCTSCAKKINIIKTNS